MPAESSRRTIRTERARFVLDRLSSLAGALPLGLFVVGHILSQARALGTTSTRPLAPSSTWVWIETVAVIAPLLLHAGIELSRSRFSSTNVRHYPHPRNWAWLLQRVSGVVALFFVSWHFFAMRWPLLRGVSEHDAFNQLCATLSTTGPGGMPFAAIGYLAGLSAVVYHLVNGVHGFCFTWGLVGSRRASRNLLRALTAFGVLLFAVSVLTVVYFATGSSPFRGA